jgi:hypothetical protein
MRLTWIVVLAGMTMACAGRLETRPISARAASDTHRKFNGIIYHPGQYVKLTYEYTTRVDEGGKITGHADDHTCTPVVQKEEVQIMPDYNRAYLLSFKPGFLNDGTLNVSLDRGMLANVNVETTSQVASVLTAVSSLASALGISGAAAMVPARSGSDVCNSEPRLSHMRVTNLDEMERGTESTTRTQ